MHTGWSLRRQPGLPTPTAADSWHTLRVPRETSGLAERERFTGRAWRLVITVVIRPIAAGDIALIERFMPPRMPGAHRERLAVQERGDALYLVAVHSGALLGHLLLSWRGSASCADSQGHWLSDIAVHPEYQSRGIGSQLLEEVERLAGERGYDRVGLSVALENVRARALYERRGYQESGCGMHRERWPYVGDHGQERWREETCVRLIKRLRAPLG